MGKLNIQEPGGHVEIIWDETTISIDLNPEDQKANRKERDRVIQLVQDARKKRFGCEVDGTPIPQDVDIPKRAKHIVLTLNGRAIKEMLSELLKTEIFAHHLLFRIKDGGKGEVLQKTEFAADEGEYATAPALAGG